MKVAQLVILLLLTLLLSCSRPAWPSGRHLHHHPQLQLLIMIHDGANSYPPIPDSMGQIYLPFDAQLDATLVTLDGTEAGISGHSNLLYQCSLFAPQKLAEGDQSMTFSLADHFETADQVQGLLYVDFTSLTYGGEPLAAYPDPDFFQLIVIVRGWP